MRILLTGANGYIGKRLLPKLLEQQHEVYCCVRDPQRFNPPLGFPGITVIKVDFLEDPAEQDLPRDFDIAYYLIHSMSSSIHDFESLELKSVHNFLKYVESTAAKQIIFLSGITNHNQLSKHLQSRKMVAEVIASSKVPSTILKAGIIVGSGSASFEIIRDLVEKLPLMIAPRWLNTHCQPIGIRDVITYLTKVVMNPQCMGRSFEIGGPDVLTYRQMLMQYAEVRKLKRIIRTLPVMTTQLSSYWLFFITSTSYKLAINLVNSMKVDVICKEMDLETMLQIRPMTYRQAIENAFGAIKQNMVISSWKDALVTTSEHKSLLQFIERPEYGCFNDYRKILIRGPAEQVIRNVWSIGGERGWYWANWLWKIRGYFDKLVGGVGLKRGRTSEQDLHAGDALDFWRVLVANREEGRLLLYAEMLVPGEAWLEFKIIEENGRCYLSQIATFRPTGVFGRLYWYALWPLHQVLFQMMAKTIVKKRDVIP